MFGGIGLGEAWGVRPVRVALSVACFDDALFPATGRAAVALLERLGHEVAYPPQTCCGQIHWTTGYHREAAGLARAYAAAFEGAALEGAEVVVALSASCAAAVRDAYPRIARAARDPALARAAEGLAVYELTEFLVDVLGVTDVGAYFPHRVAYHPVCASARTLGLADKPLRLLRAVKGLELADLPAAGECCGFGGSFAMKNADVSVAMVADKVRHIRETGADVVCAVDNSCLAHIGGALSRLRSGVRAVHLAEILAGTGPS
ncbi:L-lactate dehydrogenase complex protein LldE [Actinomadura hallensis]|uniref:L-lactate dehydrogenase complex protein LldE n=1 Tax=Actinomadura hallensis TaxID=337895 RepID=A0A543IF27_9ACTN|nr:L-lactate dehydrogenase complex protein LldE [Actinomadura hallensis]